MNDTSKRVIGYGSASVVLAGLVYGACFHKGEADVMTALGSAEAYLRMASSLPAKDASGQPYPHRVKLLRETRKSLDVARGQAPEHYIGMEFEAILAAMQGDPRGSAEWYRKAQSGSGATSETKEADVLNEARMWRKAGEPKRAISAINAYGTSFSAVNQGAAAVQKMLAHEEAGGTGSAVEVANQLVKTSKDAMALLDAGHCLVRQGEAQAAEAAYEKATSEQPIANYFRARLKIRAREIDTGLELLNLASRADQRSVRSLLKQDAKDWTIVQNDVRFRKLVNPESLPVAPGR